MQPYGGVSRYWFELLREMGKQAPGQICGFSGFHFSKLPLNELAPEIKTYGLRLPFVPKRGRRVIRAASSIPCRVALASIRPTVYHATYYDVVASPPQTKRVVTVHDLISERYWGSAHPASVAKLKSLKNADYVICVSHATRLDLLHFFPHLESRSAVIHHGIRKLPTHEMTSLMDGPYILYVGMRQGYKNFGVLVDAFRLLANCGHHEVGLLCFGGDHFTMQERESLRSIHRAFRFKHMAGDDLFLSGAYRGATAMVYPSRYEGFGLPLLEAMQCGCPVICSRSSSLPEVAGDAALYFNAESADELTHQLAALIGNSNLADQLRESGLRRVNAFSWARAASSTLNIYRGLESNIL